MPKQFLLEHLDRIHTTAAGEKRIRKNLELDENDDVVQLCRRSIMKSGTMVLHSGKNYYVYLNHLSFTINERTFTIITAHQQ